MSKNYIDNAVLESLIIRHRDNPTEAEKQQLVELLYLIADRLSYMTRDYPEIDKDDLRQTVVVLALSKIHLFVPGKGKAFSYMTQCCINEIRQIMKKQRVHNTLLSRLYEHKKKQEKF